MQPKVNPAHLPFLRVLCEAEGGALPMQWNGSGKDRTLPVKVAKRLHDQGMIVPHKGWWFSTATGRAAIGRAI